MIPCFCGCLEPAVQLHHAVTRQELRRIANKRNDGTKYLVLAADPRNLVPVALACHGNHHSKSRPYTLAVLPDSVYEFAAELMGPRAFNWLRRYYAGFDRRHENLPYLTDVAA